MKNTMINKMKNSAFGKILRRIVGEETGAVMMEYVIVAVLIAAAAVVAIAYFGKTIVGQANTATIAMEGDGHAAQQNVDKVRNVGKQGRQEAVQNNKQFSDSKVEAAGGSAQ